MRAMDEDMELECDYVIIVVLKVSWWLFLCFLTCVENELVVFLVLFDVC